MTINLIKSRDEISSPPSLKLRRTRDDIRRSHVGFNYKTDSPVYPQIGVEEIVSQAKQAEQMGATEFCLVSSGWGATSDREFETVLEAVRRISTETKLFADCSLGFLTGEQMRQLKEAGLYRNNHNLEAAKGYFENVCTTHTHEERMSHIQRARHYGIHPCSG